MLILIGVEPGKVLMEQNAEILKNAIAGSLNIIEQDREKEIVSRRFGLNGPKETLEQIGEMLSIMKLLLLKNY